MGVDFWDEVIQKYDVTRRVLEIFPRIISFIAKQLR